MKNILKNLLLASLFASLSCSDESCNPPDTSDGGAGASGPVTSVGASSQDGASTSTFTGEGLYGPGLPGGSSSDGAAPATGGQSGVGGSQQVGAGGLGGSGGECSDKDSCPSDCPSAL